MCMSEHMHVEARGQPQMLLSTSGAVHLVIDFFVVVAVVVFNLKQSVSSPGIHLSLPLWSWDYITTEHYHMWTFFV